MNLTLRYAARSDRGLVRDGNQDSVYAGPRLLAVADGMGGMAAGDVASNIVIAALAPLDEDVPGDAILDTIRGSVDTANQQLRDTVEANPQMEGMGTTLTGLLFAGSRAGLVHIGDSRAYLLRSGEFHQITKDDTYVQMLVDEGRISAEEAGSHPQRSLLTRAMDGRDIDPEYSVRTVLPGDRYLICSDGLSGVVSEETIADTTREYTDPQECVERLISLALRGGGPDNVTVIVADATDQDIMEGTPVVGGAAARGEASGDSTEHESTPAARASALNPRPPAPEPEPESAAVEEEAPARPPRRPLRTALIVLVLLALLSGGLWYGWSVTQSTYYVGATEEGEVAVFQGLPGRVAGLDLSSLHTVSDYAVDDLRPHAQERVRQGSIRAGSSGEAEQRMTELLNDELKPLCRPTPSPTPTPTPADDEDEPDPEETPDPAATATGTIDPSPDGEPVNRTPPRTDPTDCRTE
ncbi:serine/threonine-protein phosphatase [Natronosporangium hydrolyticum]|uniref:Serine/threonine protein phosphatase PstP n=1 Tax=Natronosporangium hydrolyticum TaxID=2811111 RepID=A0A895YH99_9ACTN|nr:PP2C family serine/threonine-protein phosphatase [Natronosporangium hydrolyticum]QSB14763.1 serine/threonine-protein phosphatase [Natronosporangium hydrolyticum]